MVIITKIDGNFVITEKLAGVPCTLGALKQQVGPEKRHRLMQTLRPPAMRGRLWISNERAMHDGGRFDQVNGRDRGVFGKQGNEYFRILLSFFI